MVCASLPSACSPRDIRLRRETRLTGPLTQVDEVGPPVCPRCHPDCSCSSCATGRELPHPPTASPPGQRLAVIHPCSESDRGDRSGDARSSRRGPPWPGSAQSVRERHQRAASPSRTPIREYRFTAKTPPESAKAKGAGIPASYERHAMAQGTGECSTGGFSLSYHFLAETTRGGRGESAAMIRVATLLDAHRGGRGPPRTVLMRAPPPRPDVTRSELLKCEAAEEIRRPSQWPRDDLAARGTNLLPGD